MKESVKIREITSDDAKTLTVLGLKTFLESHGHSASEEDIENYTRVAFSEEQISQEISQSENIFHFIMLNGQAVGYSKFILNTSVSMQGRGPYAKLERIYLLSEYQGLGLGGLLLDHAIELSKKEGQIGIWLHTWIENIQAIKFYQKYDFKIIGKFDFRISSDHVNPNHQMLLKW